MLAPVVENRTAEGSAPGARRVEVNSQIADGGATGPAAFRVAPPSGDICQLPASRQRGPRPAAPRDMGCEFCANPNAPPVTKSK